MRIRRWGGLFVVAGAVLALAGCASKRPVAFRPWGDMPYAPKEPPKAEDIYHLPTGLKVSVNGMMDMIGDAGLVSIGETHDSVNDHRVEFVVIRELYNRHPGKIAIGMEMFRAPQQEILDRWTSGRFASEKEFLKAVKWYETWGYDFAYYRDILQFAREKGIDVIALNPSRELQDNVSRHGLDNLSETLKAGLPEIGEPDPYQKAMLEGIFGGHKPTGGKIDAFIRTQLLWEETMAQRVANYLRSPRGEGKRVVTITGGWHVKYGFGLPKKVVRRIPIPYKILLPEVIGIPEGADQPELMDVDLPEVPLLASDFMWWVPYESLEGKRMRMGVVIAEKDNTVVVEAVTPGSPAEKAGIEKGDRIFSFDGAPVHETFDVYHPLGDKKEGDKATVVIRREGMEKTVEVTFFRIPKPAMHPKK